MTAIACLGTEDLTMPETLRRSDILASEAVEAEGLQR